MSSRATILSPLRRGEPFNYSNVLTGGWTQSMFARFIFTLRAEIPPSTQLDDSDAGVVAQATSDSGAIVFSDTTNFSVHFPSTATRLWPNDTLYWDMKAEVDANNVYSLGGGTIKVFGDITRSI